eukprot:jgi/Bigna1/140993/aug1.59_g15701
MRYTPCRASSSVTHTERNEGKGGGAAVPGIRDVPGREEMLKKLKSGDEFDILVIGGGATGAGVAVDAATRGLKVAMIEREDYGSGTSSRSTKVADTMVAPQSFSMIFPLFNYPSAAVNNFLNFKSLP